MPPKKYVMLVDGRRGPLAQLVPTLQRLDFRVLCVPEPIAAFELADNFPRLGLAAINEALNPKQTRPLVKRLRERQPTLPVMWLGDPEALAAPSALDLVLGEPDAEALNAHAERVLCQHFYPDHLTAMISDVATDALTDFGEYVSMKEAFIKSSHRPLAEINAVIMFSGAELAGHLVLGASVNRARRAHQRALKASTDATLESLGDMLGELTNRILGGISHYFERIGMPFFFGTPLCVAGKEGALWQEQRHPSLAIELDGPDGQMFLEFCVNAYSKALNQSEFPIGLVEQGQFILL